VKINKYIFPFLTPVVLPLLILCSISVKTTIAQEIDCDNTVYLSTQISTGSDLYRFQVDVDNGIYGLEEIFKENKNYRIGCLGYSVVDKMIYAVEFNSREILRINAFGEITNLGLPIGLDTTLEYYSGDMFPGGRDFFVIGKDPIQDKDVAFYSIDVFDMRATPLAVISDGDVTIQDMTRNPLDGAVYGYDLKQRKMVTVAIGQVNNYQFPSIAEQFTSLFFDTEGNLYGFGESEVGTSRKFFAIDKISSEAVLLGDGPIGFDTDACTCPYEFKFFKKISPGKALPCQEVSIEYTFLNTSGSARTNLRILDTLPEILSITEITENTNEFNTRVISGPGTNILDLTRMEVLLGEKSRIRIKAMVNPGATGIYASQATLEGLPLALNPRMLSDNPTTGTTDDPNFIEVLENDNDNFEDIIQYDCDNESALLSAPLGNALSYLWSDGSVKSTLRVNTPDIYWVEMTTECGTYRDEINVDFNNEIPFISLGEDKTLQQGTPLTLTYETNLKDIATIRWEASDPSVLSCNFCNNPSVRLLESTTVSVSLIDSRGCEVRDDISIDVQKFKAVYTPTAFSPNGDGVNDLFFFQGTNGTINHLRVFNRWGTLVFGSENGQVNDIGHAWDGDNNGSRIESGVFIWVAKLTYLDGTTEQLNGTVTLVK